jgi:putative Mn2+ efflux pump MntP
MIRRFARRLIIYWVKYLGFLLCLYLGIRLVRHRLRDRIVDRVIEGARERKLMLWIRYFLLLEPRLIEVKELIVELGLTG